MTVSDILDERTRFRDAPGGLVAGISILGHLLFLAGLILLSAPRRTALPPPVSLPVRVVSPGSLSRPAASSPPAEKARPVIEKPRSEEVVKPSPKALPAPEKVKVKEKKKPEPPKAPGLARWAGAAETNGPGAVDLPAGAGAGPPDATGTANFGASVSSFDAEFPFAYYIEQLQSLIGANWLKPTVPDGTGCVVTFRIQKSGQVTDVRVEVPSGLAFYDRAASRAIYAANPLPPLPPEFKRDQLGVHIRFQ